jgi:hypothetical protein
MPLRKRDKGKAKRATAAARKAKLDAEAAAKKAGAFPNDSEETLAKLLEYQNALKARGIGEVQKNLIPKEKAIEYMDTALRVDMLRYVHDQQFRPVSIEMNIDLGDVSELSEGVVSSDTDTATTLVLPTSEGKWITLNFMEYNGSWKKPHMSVCVSRGKSAKKSNYYLTDLADYQAELDRVSLGKDIVGEAAFIITDLKNKPVVPDFDTIKAHSEYVLHLAPKHVRFAYEDEKGNTRELLQAVRYGEPKRQLMDRVRWGLGISEWAPMTVMRDGTPIHAEFKNFRFSSNAHKIDSVTIDIRKFSAQNVRYSEYPVERISEFTLVSLLALVNILIARTLLLLHALSFSTNIATGQVPGAVHGDSPNGTLLVHPLRRHRPPQGHPPWPARIRHSVRCRTAARRRAPPPRPHLRRVPGRPARLTRAPRHGDARLPQLRHRRAALQRARAAHVPAEHVLERSGAQGRGGLGV